MTWRRRQRTCTDINAWFPPFHCRSAVAVSPFQLHKFRKNKALSTLATVAKNGDCRRIRKQIVTEFGDYSRQCGQGLT